MKGIAVGVDAGGTATRASLSRDGEYCNEVSSGGASASAVGVQEAARRIIAVVESVAGAQSPDAIYVGAAGAGRPAVALQLQSAITQRFGSAQVAVVDDARIVLRTVSARGPGIALIAGTGSIAYAENADDASFRAGGYGYLLGDDGSGFSIGLAAARVFARVLDGRGPADELTAMVGEKLGALDQAALFEKVYANDAKIAALASLAQPVIALANSGVRSANKIVQAAALELGELAKLAAKKAGILEAVVPLVLAGGLFKENSVLTFLLETRLQNDLPSAQIHKGGPEPHRGALAAAEAMLG